MGLQSFTARFFFIYWNNTFLWRHTIIIFKNLQFILLFLNIWTLTFYCFRLKKRDIFWDFRVSNHCGALKSLLWLSKLPSNHSATVTTLPNYIMSKYMTLDSNLCKKKISTICLKKQLINIYKTRYK